MCAGVYGACVCSCTTCIVRAFIACLSRSNNVQRRENLQQLTVQVSSRVKWEFTQQLTVQFRGCVYRGIAQQLTVQVSCSLKWEFTQQLTVQVSSSV